MCQVSYSRTEDLPGVFLIGVRILAEAESVLDYYSETRILRYQLVSMHVKYISCTLGIPTWFICTYLLLLLFNKAFVSYAGGSH